MRYTPLLTEVYILYVKLSYYNFRVLNPTAALKCYVHALLGEMRQLHVVITFFDAIPQVRTPV